MINKKYSVLVAGCVVEEGMSLEAATFDVAQLKDYGYTEPTKRCEFVVPDAAYSTNWGEHSTFEDFMFEAWFELSETIDDSGHSSMAPRYQGIPALHLMH
jgi:hypothetical protein